MGRLWDAEVLLQEGVCVFSGAIIFHSNKHAFHSNTHEVPSYFFALAVTIRVHTSLLGVRGSQL